MAGMPISGSYIMLATRMSTAVVLIGVSVWAVPAFKKQTSIGLAVMISGLSVAFLAYLLYQSALLDLSWGLGGWYRNILEVVSIVSGCVFGVNFSATLKDGG